jgi:hypothetical protein
MIASLTLGAVVSTQAATSVTIDGASSVLSDDFSTYADNTALQAGGQYQVQNSNGGEVGVDAGADHIFQINDAINPDGEFTRFKDTGSVDSTLYSAASYSFDINMTDPGGGTAYVGISLTGDTIAGLNSNNTYLGDSLTGDGTKNVLSDHIGFSAGLTHVDLIVNWGSNSITLSDTSTLAAGKFKFYVDGVAATLANDNVQSATIATDGDSLGINIFTFQNQVGNYTLDNYDVSAIPEPGTYALLAGLLALTRVALRRRRS